MQHRFNLDELRYNKDEPRCNLDLTLVVVSTLTGWWVGGWSEEWRVMQNSTQDQIKLKLKFELSLTIIMSNVCNIHFLVVVE